MKDMLRGIVFVGIFTIPFIVLLVTNSLFFPFITGKNFAFRIIVEIIFAAWVLLAFYDVQYRPRFSHILGAFGAFVVAIFFADLFGVSPHISFWSNYERMEGFVTIIHLFMYFVVVGSVIKTDKLWNRLFITNVVAASFLAIYAFAQLSGNITINQGGWRLDGTLGNSAYMAIYGLYMTFMAAFLFVRTQSRGLKYLYGAYILLFIFLIVQTATRGTIIGLAGGSFITAAYIALFSKGHPNVRKAAFGGLIAVVAIVGLFITFRHSPFIQDNPYLRRLTEITLSQGDVRFTIWHMALEGVKERPIFGWGQSNFNYIFNKYYDPVVLHSAEPWFDRVHDIVLDWLVAGGIVGLFTYFAILGAALWYIFLRPILKSEDSTFTVVERGLLLGLFAGYFFHNLFVFDNIVSYIFYGMFLAFIHSRVSTEIKAVEEWHIDQRAIEQIALPVVGVAALVVVYWVNIPSILAAGDIIKGYQATDPVSRMNAFETALSRGGFGDQEIREQMVQAAEQMIRSPQLSSAQRQDIVSRTQTQLLNEIKEKPGDARIEVFTGSFFRSINDIPDALTHLKTARELSPNKQQIIFEQGLTSLQGGQYDQALDFFKQAYDLAPEYDQARIYYATAALYDGKPEMVDQLINTDVLKHQFYKNDIAAQGAYQAKQYDLLKDMFNYRVEKSPNDQQLRVNLAVIYYQSGDTPGAISILEQAVKDIPAFKAQGEQFIADLKAGRVPGAQPAATPSVSTSPTVQVVPVKK